MCSGDADTGGVDFATDNDFRYIRLRTRKKRRDRGAKPKRMSSRRYPLSRPSRPSRLSRRPFFLLLPLGGLLAGPSACGDGSETVADDIESCRDDTRFLVGSGMHDITGPAEGLGMMGYALLGQKTQGIHTRLWARAHVIESPCSKKRVAFVSADLQSISLPVKQAVMRRLGQIYGTRYSDANVLLSATHTHSGPGGFSFYALYDLTIKGVNHQNVDAIVKGITEAIVKADMSLEPAQIRSGSVVASAGEAVGVNRSVRAYMRNPAEERAKYTSDTNRELTLLRFDRADGTSPGLINWYAVHGTSMSGKNHLISSDNKGRASFIFEEWKRRDRNKGGTFVASFAQSDEGDVSPTSPLGSNADGHADGHNTQQAGVKQFNLARKAYDGAQQTKGSIGFVHTYVKFDRVEVAPEFTGGTAKNTCVAAIGVSMLAGTEDGKGFGEEGTSCETVRDRGILSDLVCATRGDVCHAEKPVAVWTGSKRPVPWTPEVLPLQILRVADTAIVGVPFELTTMAGRRLRAQVLRDLQGTGVGRVVIAGLANAYAGYVATREEYMQQDYEGASTHFGPYELGAILQEVHKLAVAMKSGASVPPGPTPRSFARDSVIPIDVRPTDDPTPFDTNHGDLVTDAKDAYTRPGTVSVSFVGAHPARNLQSMGSYFYVERQGRGGWEVVQTDDHPDNEIHFVRHTCRLGSTCTRADIIWQVRSTTEPGTYRIRFVGDALQSGHTRSFEGVTRTFVVR